MNPILTMRPTEPEDEPFLRALQEERDVERLFLDALPPEMSEAKKRIVESQYQAREDHYANVNWDQTDCLILVEGERVGRFIVMQNSEEIRLADIVVAKAHRGKGIGLAVIQGIQGECMQSKRPLRLHVERNGPALGFYQQLGFQLLEERGTHYFMEWRPAGLDGRTLHFSD